MSRAADVRHIGILLCDTANPFWRSKKDAYREQAAESGFQVHFHEAADSLSPKMQADLLKQLYSAGYDAVIVNPLTSDNLLEAIQAAPFPVLDVGPKCDPARAKEILNYHPLWVTDFVLQGSMAASALVEGLSPSPEGMALIVAGIDGARQSVGRCRGAADVFRRLFPTERILCIHADFERGRARAALLALAGRIDLAAVFCANDLMAMGAVEAFEELGLTLPPIGGVDAIDEALAALRAGRLAATVGISEPEVVRGVDRARADVLAGRQLPDRPLVQSVLYQRGREP